MEGGTVMTREDTWTLAGIALGIGALALACRARALAPGPQARYEGAQAPGYSVWHPGDSPGGIQHTAGTDHPWIARDVYGSVVSRHRYPSGCAQNVTALIFRGWDPLSRPAPQDADWFRDPPSDVMW